MTSSSLRILLVAASLVGCGGAAKTPAQPDNAAPPQSTTGQESVASSASASQGSESAGPSGTASAGPPPPSSAESAAQPPRRRGSVDIAIAGKHAGDATLDRVVSSARTGLENCYETGLASEPTAAGVLDFQIHVTASGAIKKVESAHPNTMPGTVATCMVGKFGALSFEPKPATTIEVKVTCRPNE